MAKKKTKKKAPAKKEGSCAGGCLKLLIVGIIVTILFCVALGWAFRDVVSSTKNSPVTTTPVVVAPALPAYDFEAKADESIMQKCPIGKSFGLPGTLNEKYHYDFYAAEVEGSITVFENLNGETLKVGYKGAKQVTLAGSFNMNDAANNILKVKAQPMMGVAIL